MTNKSALLELASRIDAATGPDRELDLAIALAVGDETWAEPDRAKLYYTASLDAAMSLVPEGLIWLVQYRIRVYAEVGRCFATAATPSLALTAAALRAIAKERG